MSFRNLKVGDTVIRLMAGIKINMVVVEIDDNLLYCNSTDTLMLNATKDDLWTFDRDTGIEEDEYLGWGMKFKKTGSQLVKE